MAKVVEPSKQGVAEVSHFTVSKREAEFSRLREITTRGREQAVGEGAYAQLKVGGRLVMSDTQMERDTNTELIERARGEVLIAGLGLGMVLLPLAKLSRVTSILVIEKERDVIDLVMPRIRAELRPMGVEDKLLVREADIMAWTPTRTRWDTIYFDIWPNICRDNLKEMKALHARFRPKLRPEGWMSSWLYEDLKQGYV